MIAARRPGCDSAEGMFRASRYRTVKAAFLTLLLAASCTPPMPPLTRPVKVPMPPLRGEPLPELTPPGFPAVVLAELATPETDAAHLEPKFRFARNRTRGLLAARSGGQWLVGPVRIDRDDASALSPADDASGMRPVHPAPDGTPSALHPHGDGFILAWAEAVDGEWLVKALALDGSGKPRGDARVALRASQPVQWLGAYGDGETMFLVCDRSRGPTHELTVAAAERGAWSPAQVVEGGTSWNAAASKGGLWIASTSGKSGAGAMTVTMLSRRGDRLNVSTQTLDEPGVAQDVQVAAMNGAALLAWNARVGVDLRVYVARVGIDGGRSKAVRLDPVGSHALVDLVASGDRRRALVAFERAGATSERERTVELVGVDQDGSPTTSRAALSVHTPDERVPRFFGDGSGFGMLTVAPLKLRGAQGEAADGPTVVRLDANLRLRSSEPVRIGEFPESAAGQGVPVELRAPSCEDDLCTAVAVSDGGQPLLALVKMPVRDLGWVPASRAVAPLEPPLAEELETLAEFDGTIADFAAAELLDGRILLAWLEDGSSPAPGETGPAALDRDGARLQFRIVEKDGTLGEVVTVSDKAFSAGGLDVVALPAGSNGTAVLAWVGPNPGPQVFLTRIGAKGERLQQKTVTRLPRIAPGVTPRSLTQVLDVDLAQMADGSFLCAWSDTRAGEPEVHLARVSPKLERRGSELRVTTTPGASTEPQLSIHSSRILVAWSETSQGSTQGDIHLVPLDPKATAVTDRARELARSAGHSRAPGFAPAPSGVALSWLDEPTRPASGGLAPAPDDIAGLRMVSLDSSGEPLAQLVRIPADSAGTSSAAVRCDEGACRALLVSIDGSEYRFDAIATSMGTAAAPLRRTVARLPFTTQTDVRLHLTHGAERAFFVEEQDGKTLMRGLRLRWIH